MAKKVVSKTTNKILFDIIIALKKATIKTKKNVYKAVAFELSKSASQRTQINLNKIDKHSVENEFIIIPGKVLGDGNLTKKINVISFKASKTAIEKINKIGGKFIFISDYVKKIGNEKLKILK